MNFVVLCEGLYHRRRIVADNSNFVKLKIKLNGFHVVLNLKRAFGLEINPRHVSRVKSNKRGLKVDG